MKSYRNYAIITLDDDSIYKNETFNYYMMDTLKILI